MDEIIGEIIAQMEDNASTGDAQEMRGLASALNHLAYALRARARAVELRLQGNVHDALRAEEMSEWGVRHAWGGEE